MSLLSKFPTREYKTIYEYLHDYTGCSKKQKLMDDLSDFLYFEKLSWAYRNHCKFSPEVCLVTVSEPETGELLELGGSLPNDLFLDNWGFSWAGLFAAPTTSAVTAAVHNTSGTAKTLNMIFANGTATFTRINAATNLGSQIQIGSGSTAPARADNAIQTAFSTAPENAAFATGNGSYSAGSGNVTVSGSITAGNESATINEALLIGLWCDSAPSQQPIAICHDATTATPFTNAKSITVQYSITD